MNLSRPAGSYSSRAEDLEHSLAGYQISRLEHSYNLQRALNVMALILK